MTKLLLIIPFFLFSREDLREHSIPSIWFLYLGIFLLFILCFLQTPVFSSWTQPLFPHIHAQVSSFLGVANWSPYGFLPVFSPFNPFVLKNLSLCLLPALYGCFFGFILIAIPYYASRKKGMGSGDVWYFSLLSGVFTLPVIWCAYLFSFSLGVAWCLFGKVFHRIDSQARIPFIPFLSLGFLLAAFL